MKLFIVGVLLAMAQLGTSEMYNINDDVDRGLKIVNKYATGIGKGFESLERLTFGNVTMSKGGLVGINSLRRTGEATLTTHDDEGNFWTVDMHVGQRVYYLAFGRVNWNGVMMSGVFKVANHSFHMSYTVVNETGACRLHLHQYSYESMAPASFDSSNPAYSGDVSGFFTHIVLPTINRKVAAARDKVQVALEKVACMNSHHQANHYEDILKAAFMHGKRRKRSWNPTRHDRYQYQTQ